MDRRICRFLLIDLGLRSGFPVRAGQGVRAEGSDRLLIRYVHLDWSRPSPEIAREASLIRESLEKLQTGDDEGGLALLRELPRSSLLSDWKFFVRGLAAHYRGESEECQANWGRLDANRKACRIAARLRQQLGRIEHPQ